MIIIVTRNNYVCYGHDYDYGDGENDYNDFDDDDDNQDNGQFSICCQFSYLLLLPSL